MKPIFSCLNVPLRTVTDFALVVSDVDGSDRWLQLMSQRLAHSGG